jgi:MFS family permease
MAEPNGTTRRLPRNVLLLGLVSFFTDVGSEMAMPLLPAFVETLGGGALALSRIEGIATAVASLLMLVSGILADRIGRNRPLVIAGYGISALVRPLLALAASPAQVGLIRGTDRIGKGLRGSPRDALIAASVAPERRAAAFGLHRAMDHAGAFVGPLLAFVLLHFAGVEVRTIFWLTAVPGLCALGIAVFGVREVRGEARAAAAARDAPAPRRLGRVLLPIGLFALGGMSELLLLLKAGASRVPVEAIPLLWVGLHLVKSLLATSGGRLADRIGRRRTLAIGWTLHALIFVALGLTTDRVGIVILILLHGARCALTEGAEKALVAEIAPKHARGRAFGAYHVVIGLLALASAELFGRLWEGLGDQVAFHTAAGIALTAVAALAALRR